MHGCIQAMKDLSITATISGKSLSKRERSLIIIPGMDIGRHMTPRKWNYPKTDGTQYLPFGMKVGKSCISQKTFMSEVLKRAALEQSMKKKRTRLGRIIKNMLIRLKGLRIIFL